MMTPAEIEAGESRLAELNSKNNALRRDLKTVNQSIEETRKLLRQYEDTREHILVKRMAVKTEYGELYEDVGIAKKEAARMREAETARKSSATQLITQ